MTKLSVLPTYSLLLLAALFGTGYPTFEALHVNFLHTTEYAGIIRVMSLNVILTASRLTTTSDSEEALTSSSPATTAEILDKKEVVFRQLTTEENEAIKDYCSSRTTSVSIEGGDLAEVGQFPYEGVLVNSSTGVTSCSLFVVSSWHVMTARHCIYEAAVAVYEAFVGGVCFGLSDTCPTVDMFRVDVEFGSIAEKAPASPYRGRRFDAAILQLRQELPNSVKPACLPRVDTSLSENDKVLITGFGGIGSGDKSTRLKYASQRVANSDDEYFLLNDYCFYPEFFICTVPTVNPATPGARGGDSGSALTTEDDPRTAYGIEVLAQTPSEAYPITGTTSLPLSNYVGDICRLLGRCDEGAEKTVFARFTEQIDFPPRH